MTSFELVNLIRNFENAMARINGFSKVDISELNPEKPLRVWFSVDSVEHLNTFLWAGCHRYFCLGPYALFEVKADHGDPENGSSELKLVMETNKPFTENDIPLLEEFVNNLSEFIENYVFSEENANVL